MVKERSRRIEGKKEAATAVAEVNRGAWTAEEDRKLVDYVVAHGDKHWRTLASKAGLKRCGKSCRLRWLNYLRPGIKRGNISEDEEDLIIRLHNLLGNRWSIIAGRIPGRTDNEIKNHWNTHLRKKSLSIEDLNKKQNCDPNIASNRVLTTSTPASTTSKVPLSSTPWPAEQIVNDGPAVSSRWVDQTANSEFDIRGLSGLGSDFGLDHDFGLLPTHHHHHDNNNNSNNQDHFFEFEYLEQFWLSYQQADALHSPIFG